MPASANVSGQAYAFMAMTPVKPDEHEALTDYLRGLRGRGERPLSRLPRTHLGRFVVVPDFYTDPLWKQRHAEHLDLPYLIFTSNLDGDLDSYLDELCEELAPEAAEIWGRCVGCPAEARGPALKAYLLHNQINSGVFFAAYGHATVETVKRCLRQRERMIEFAQRAQGMRSAGLHQAFVEQFGEGR